MTPEARAFLADCARRTVVITSGDRRREMITELQRGGFVRLAWQSGGKLRGKTQASAGVVVTEAGLVELGNKDAD